MIEKNLKHIIAQINNRAKLIAVSKKQGNDSILAAYNLGQRDFGENYVQELADKSNSLPKDINWHMIGHLQTNKVKYIAPFVHLIHSVDTSKLLKEINKQAKKNERVIPCLLQLHIADESTKTGFDSEELNLFLQSTELSSMENIRIIGLMGMATFTDDENKIVAEFKELTSFVAKMRNIELPKNVDLEEVSMGMSGDWELAIKSGSTMLRIGSSIFGART
jgi:PLP dependent protein